MTEPHDASPKPQAPIPHPAHTLPPISRLAIEDVVNAILGGRSEKHAAVRTHIAVGRQWDRPSPPCSPLLRVGLSLGYHDARGIDAYFTLRVNDDLSITIKTNLPNYSDVEPPVPDPCSPIPPAGGAE